MSSFENIWERYKALDQRNPYITHLIFAVAFGVMMALDLNVKPGPDSIFVQEDAFGYVLAAFIVLPVITMRAAPLASLTTIYAAFVIHGSFEYELLWISQMTTLAGLFMVASTTSDRKSIIAAIMTVVALSIVFGLFDEKFDSLFALILLFAFVWVVGNVVRTRKNRLAAAEITVTDLVDERENMAREAIRGERARIARELHDVLGHTLNLVVIQAGAAQRVFKSSPEKALEAVKSIESTSRQALSDVDRMLGIMRDPDEAANTALSFEARPSLSRINKLVTELKSTGQSIELTLTGNESKLVASTDLTAYRVVQEALTNVMTHAAGSKAQVEIDYGDNQLEVTITNDGSGTDTLAGRKSGGRGIVGMRERTSLFGGNFEAGSTSNGGWRVNATFPISRNDTVDDLGDSE